MDFFEQGAEFLKPLKMQEVADVLGIHNSTVSRAISGKWIETPRGIFPMKFFFASAAPRNPTQGPAQVAAGAADPDDRTRLSLMEKIREIVDAEDRKHPLSDLEIVRILKQQGIAAARRTVAKYREEMSIPSSRLRRQY
jgi:RNA polymerase sigma-54 factor